MEPMKRPKGISILAVLHLIGGVIGAIAIIPLVLTFIEVPEASQALDEMGIPPISVLINLTFILIITIASGIGMWRGKRWGWYLGSFYYLYSVFRNASALISLPRMLAYIPPEEMENAQHQPSFYYAKHIGRVIVHFLFYLYFFKGNVREFFSITEQKKWQPIAIEFGICVAISGIGILLSILN
jgi:hypothetical protein